ELGRVTGLGRSVGADEADSTIVRPLPMPDRDIVDLIVSCGPSVRSADASGGYSVYAQPATRGSLVDGGNAWQFRIGVVYPIFDGFQREDGVSRADAEADAATATRADTRREARAAAERGLANLNVAGERIRLAE